MDLQPILDAIVGHKWALVFAGIVGLLVAAMKQGWLGTWVANKLPPAARPWLSIGLGVASLLAADLQAGKTWQQAVFDGISAGMIAIFGHDFVIEGMRKGKEIIPEKNPSPPTDPKTPYRTPADPLPADNGSTPNVSKMVRVFAWGFGLLMKAGEIIEASFDVFLTYSRTRQAVLMFVCTIPIAFASATGCKGPITANEVEDGVLSVAQIACIEISQYSDVQDLVNACQIEQSLTPAIQQLIQQLVGQREAAKRAGFKWTPPDAGTVSNAVDGGS